MKKLEEYIAEAYDTKSNMSVVQPKNKTELKKIIKDAFAHKQYDLNFIDTSKITDMQELFEYCEHDFDVSSWDVSKVKYMSYIFHNCLKFKGKGLENWDVSNVTDMRFMFSCLYIYFYLFKFLFFIPTWNCQLIASFKHTTHI